MCLQSANVVGSRLVSWGGDRILHRCVVPSVRPAVSVPRDPGYPIDIREFLVTERNEVISRAIREGVRGLIESTPTLRRQRKRRRPGSLSDGLLGWGFFKSRERGSFDYRVAMVSRFLQKTIRYKRCRVDDPWRFPDETLHLGYGDCEDIAFLAASLCLASGVSAYNIRVALGQVALKSARGKVSRHDHAWLVYKSEAGQWLIIDPFDRPSGAPARKSRPRKPVQCLAQYLPRFVFNDAHLWGVGSDQDEDAFKRLARGRLGDKTERRRFDPSFAGEVHQSILKSALEPVLGAGHWFIDELNRRFHRLLLFGPLVENIDADFGGYDPRDHFDNGYIEESWQRVVERLDRFEEDNADVDAFAAAAHGIADFYAHSSYAHFQPPGLDGTLLPALRNLFLFQTAAYDTGDFDLTGTRYGRNSRHAAAMTQAAAALQFGGRLISGRYAQQGDGGGIPEGITWIPGELESDPTFPARGFLPHHDEIAVDGATPGGKHVLYDQSTYLAQFALRRDAAIAHIREVFTRRWHGEA